MEGERRGGGGQISFLDQGQLLLKLRGSNSEPMGRGGGQGLLSQCHKKEQGSFLTWQLVGGK